MRICTIGFRGKLARQFFTLLQEAGVQKVLDIRRKNQSQLAGFTKGRDLEFFLDECFGIQYEHIPLLAPSEDLLKEYRRRLGRKKRDDAVWAYYVDCFGAEIAQRPVVGRFNEATVGLDVVCLLCSEETADCCHRRLIAEHVAERIEGIVIEHL
ncbi:MAG: DUF488 domain-containing protein [Candidatus Brocadiae bacterium]|nr:DUF488 domain-containing protein [Candidatus Brocadiia bacterium]